MNEVTKGILLLGGMVGSVCAQNNLNITTPATQTTSPSPYSLDKNELSATIAAPVTICFFATIFGMYFYYAHNNEAPPNAVRRVYNAEDGDQSVDPVLPQLPFVEPPPLYVANEEEALPREFNPGIPPPSPPLPGYFDLQHAPLEEQEDPPFYIDNEEEGPAPSVEAIDGSAVAMPNRGVVVTSFYI